MLKINGVSLYFALFLLIMVPFFNGCKKKNEPEATTETDVSMIMGKYGCFGCHTLDGSGFRGPSFKGLMGRPSKLKSGTTITVDEAYIRLSIKDPSANEVEGYVSGLMPQFKIPEAELDLIVEFLKKQ